MKYLHVIASLDPVNGGPPEAVRQLSLAAARQGHAPEIATLDAPDAPFGAECGCPVHQLGPSAGGNFRFSARLRPWLRNELPRFDAVVVDGLWQYHGPAVRIEARHANIPYFVYPHGMLDPWFRHAFPARHAKKQLYWLAVERRVVRDARALLFTCEEERRLARHTFWPYRAAEFVAPIGTPGPACDAAAGREAFLARFPALRGRPFLLFMGRIHPKKGIDLLLRAVARLQADGAHWPVVVAGPDADGELPALRRLADSLGLRDVTWAGMLTGDVKWGAMYCGSAFVLPSHQENFGIVVAEALACGLPVLISNRVNIWREIEADEAGMVDEDSEAGTTRLLKAWSSLDAGARAGFSERARRTFASRFHVDAAARSLVAALALPGTAQRETFVA